MIIITLVCRCGGGTLLYTYNMYYIYITVKTEGEFNVVSMGYLGCGDSLSPDGSHNAL